MRTIAAVLILVALLKASVYAAPGNPPIDCTLVDCALPKCPNGAQPVVPPGQCCPVCLELLPIDCTLVDCALPKCPDGAQPVVPLGQCCPVCPGNPPIDCTLVDCALPKCPNGAQPVVPPGQCCPVCLELLPIDCTLVDCALPKCPNGAQPVVPPGQCCPVCPDQPPIDCSAVLCLLPVCPNGAEPVVPPGQCCPVCPDPPVNCSGVTCTVPLCPQFVDPVVPPGECCAVCPDTGCSIEGQVFTECGSPCPATCANPTPICTLQCVAGCQCPPGTVLDERANKCVNPKECTCPPDCTAAFCTRDGNAKARCSIPGPREIPGCTGQCQLTFCQACYFSENARDLPGSCRDCGSPISSERCLRRWANCIHRADIRENGEPEASCMTQDKFQCYRYPCQLRG